MNRNSLKTVVTQEVNNTIHTNWIWFDVAGIMDNEAITAGELCEEIGISKMTFYRAKKGKSELKLSTLLRLCNALNMDIKKYISVEVQDRF